MSRILCKQGGSLLLKKVGIGCGAFVAIIVVIVIIVSVAGDGGDNEAVPSLQLLETINVRDIWADYENNETQANNTYKGDRWLAVKLDDITKIESGGKVRMDMDGYGSEYIELDFKNDDDVFTLKAGDSVVVICQLYGFQSNAHLEFDNCRWP